MIIHGRSEERGKNSTLKEVCLKTNNTPTVTGCKELNEIVWDDDMQVCEQVIRIPVIGIWRVSWKSGLRSGDLNV
jgi:hypothetical protein